MSDPNSNTPKSNGKSRVWFDFKKSTRGSDVLVFLICLGIATVFWLFLSLYDEVEKDYDVPFEIENLPDSIVIVDQVPPTVNVVVQGKGVQFLRFLWHDLPALKVKFENFSSTSGYFSIPRQKLDGLFRDYFGQGVKIVSIRPESIRSAFTSNVGRKLPVVINCDVQPNMQYVISGPIASDVDSVMVYSATDLPRDLVSVETYPVVRSGLKDTTEFIVKIRPVEGLRIIPDQIRLTVPVEPLIAKKRTVSIVVVNVPDGVRLITFPSSAEVSFLVPMSEYGKESNIRLFVDFGTIDRTSQKVKVQASSGSLMLKNLSFKPDSVEYIIEAKHNNEPDVPTDTTNQPETVQE